MFAFLISLIAAFFAFNTHDFNVLYSAAVAFRSGVNPYTVPMFVSPLNVFLYFVPISFIPEPLAFRMTIFLSTFVYCVVLYRASHGNLVTVAIAITTPLFIRVMVDTNVEWLVVLASIVNPLLGFFLAMMKPQICGVLTIVLLIEIYRRYNWRVVVMCCTAQAVLYLASFALQSDASSIHAALGWTLYSIWNIGIFPFGLALGVPLAVYAIRRCERFAALAAGPLISPYVNPQSWVVMLPWLAGRRRLLIAVWAGSWAFVMSILAGMWTGW